jgi:FMN-dependent NADH-azoreductase
MTTPQITIHNVITDEIITRDLNATELAQYEADAAQAEKDAKAKAKADKTLADKRQIILDRLGLTADEFAALLG